MIARLIEGCAQRRGPVLAGVALAVVASLVAVRHVTLDALPDVGRSQVVVMTEWMGRGPSLVETEVTFPIVTTLTGVAGAVDVRGESMFGMSFVHVVFDDDADALRARDRVAEALAGLAARLPSGAVPALGPDAGATGWVFQYVLVDGAGRLGPQGLRAVQDATVRPALRSVPGVAEVASVGGFERQWQVIADPACLGAHGLTLADVVSAVRAASGDAGGGVLVRGGREVEVRGRGDVRSAADLEAVAIRAHGAAGAAVRVRDVARVHLGPAPRRGMLDWNGEGETAGGIVVMRRGGNALDVVKRVKARLAELAPALSPGVRVESAYDRSALVERAVATLRDAVAQEVLVVALVLLLFLLDARAALLPALSLPIAVALTFVPMALLGIPATIMSLGGIAIALGAAVDAEIVMIEAAHRRLEHAPHGADRRALLAEAAREVTPAIFFSLLVVALAFLPVFALDGPAGRLFRPLAWTKTLVMLSAALLSVTFAPALRDLLLRGRVRPEAEHPLSRLVLRVYEPFVAVALRNPRSTLAIGLFAVLSAVPLWLELGTEFMPALDEGDLLYMPTTLPGLSAEEAAHQLAAQDRVLRSFPEVESVLGKAGRADTATDPAPLSMVETTIRLKPRDAWRRLPFHRWWSDWAPAGVASILRRVWPEERAANRDELVAELDRALRFPGWTNAFTMPIKARTDMLATGIRTAVGVKILGRDLAAIERVGIALERVLAPLRGARSVVFERSGGGVSLEVVPRREALARQGLRPADVARMVEQAVGGEVAGEVGDGLDRISVSVRFPAELRSDVERIRLLPVPSSTSSAGPAGGHAAMAGSGDGEAAAPGAGHAHEDSDEGVRGSSALRGSGSMGSFRPLPVPALGWLDAAASADPGHVGASVPLGEVADVELVEGPAMIADENGLLAGTVHVDVDESERDVSGFAAEAREVVERAVASGAVVVPAGCLLRFAGQHELVERTRARLAVVVPLALLAIGLLLWLLFRSVAEVLIVLLSVPFALVGSVWLLWLLDYRLSTAVWVGIVALVGLAAQTGVVMIVYIDAAYERRRRAGAIRLPEDVVAAHLEGTVQRVRPKLMTVGTMLAGLAPLLWATGSGSDVMRRIAAPMVGGLVTSAVLTLEIIPVVYTLWRTEQLLWAWLATIDPAVLGRLRRRAAVTGAGAVVVGAAAGLALALPQARLPGSLVAAAGALVALAGGWAWLRARTPAARKAWAVAARSDTIPVLPGAGSHRHG